MSLKSILTSKLYYINTNKKIIIEAYICTFLQEYLAGKQMLSDYKSKADSFVCSIMPGSGTTQIQTTPGTTLNSLVIIENILILYILLWGMCVFNLLCVIGFFYYHKIMLLLEYFYFFFSLFNLS